MDISRIDRPTVAVNQGELLINKGRLLLSLATTKREALVIGTMPFVGDRQALALNTGDVVLIPRADWLAFVQAQQQPICCPTCGSMMLQDIAVLDSPAHRCVACRAEFIPGPVDATWEGPEPVGV